ncbi:MAG TPA: type IV secretory system conjugative DNA transfer family protein [Candidatus Binataceae bacterium]|nr:type IV secretory system conjugative DNA transfer family protein [Candidatus Binataceae bacterium]
MSAVKKNFFNIVILVLSTVDRILLGWLWEGLLIIGGPGSGKSSCVGRQVALGLLKGVPELGALILTAKSEETANWIRYAKESGRERDLIIFNAESGHCFDPLHYEWTRKGRGAGDLESIIDLFSTLVALGKQEAGHTQDAFWERGCEQLIRNVLKLLDLAGERISIVNIDRVIKSLPTRPYEHEDEAWQKESYCAQLITQVRARQESLTPDQWSDLEVATQYIFTKWPAFDERPRSSLEMTWSGMADKFLFNPFNRLFCSGECSFTPEMTTHGHKLIVCDFPLLEYGVETGKTINVLLKLIFQRAWLRRDLADSPNPVLLWQDEFQYFVNRRDNFFQETCRGFRVAVVCLTQNILAVSEALGETQPGSKTKSLLGNLATKIFLQQNETETTSYAADQVGKEYRFIENFNADSGSEQGQSHTSIGGSRQLAHLIEPIEFTRLAKPDSDNPLAQAIVYQSGRTFNATRTERNPKGRSYLSVFFSRE